VGGHAEGDNLAFIAVLLEIERVVALMAVDYKLAVYANSAPLCMLIKVL
jgi:hypothetical protein